MTMQLILAQESGVSMQQYMLLASVLLAGFVFMRVMRKATPSDGTPKQYRREIDSATKQHTAMRADMEQLLIELDKLSREVSGQIDTRFTKLEQSIADADKRIAAMRILLEACKNAGASLAPADDQSVRQQSGAGESPAMSGHTTAGGDSRMHRIYQLADQGLSPMQIAQQLEEHPGEVELILNLREAASHKPRHSS